MKDAVVIGINPVTMTADIMYRDTHERQRGVKIAGSVYRNLKEKDFVLVDFLHNEPDSPVIMNTLMLPKDSRITDEASVLDAINFIHEVKRVLSGLPPTNDEATFSRKWDAFWDFVGGEMGNLGMMKHGFNQ